MIDPATSRSAGYEHARSRVQALRRFYRHLTIYAVVNTGLVAINLLSSSGRLWFFWPMGGWGLGLLVHGVTLWSGSYRR